MTDDATYRKMKQERDLALAECERLRAALEIERMRLAGCGVAAMQNTEASKAERITKDNPYWSASYGDVCRAVDAEIEARENYLGACETIAKMHAAAVGEITGPIRGVVEDVVDVKLNLDLSLAECERLRALLICTRSSVALDLRMYGQLLDRKGAGANDCDTDEYARIEKLLNDIDAIDAARAKP